MWWASTTRASGTTRSTWRWSSSPATAPPTPPSPANAGAAADNPLYTQQGNPTRQVFKRKDNPSNPSAGEAGHLPGAVEPVRQHRGEEGDPAALDKLKRITA